MTQEEIARRIGIRQQSVNNIINKALALIRQNPELKGLWRAYVAEGLPPAPSAPDVGGQLLVWRRELQRWYDAYEILLQPEPEEGEANLVESEAVECLAEIARFHAVLGRMIGQISDAKTKQAICRIII